MPVKNKHSIATYAALKTCIMNGEEQLVKELLDKKPMQELEKDYLIELAKVRNNQTIIKLLKDVPLN